MMSVSPQPIVNLVPETAPFSDEQRAWLNGFFAGLVSLDGAGVTALSPEQNAALMPQTPGDGDDGEAPWHDQTLPMAERMTLAEGRPLRRRMMAAMAQQDCGQCGYNCNDYADKIFDKSEERLNLCVPGGKETARMLKQLYEEIGNAPAAAKVPATAAAPAPAKPAGEAGRSRDNPAIATFVGRYRLNKSGSEKETFHLDFDLSAANLDYVVGDAFGLFPTNAPELVEAIIEALGVQPDLLVAGRPLRSILIEDVSLSPAPDSLFQLFSYITGGERRQKAKALASGDDPDGDAVTLDVLATLEKFAGVRPDPEAFIEALEPLQPRLYSISSSPKVESGRLSLTVDTVRYRIGQRLRKGVASNFLAERVKPGDPVKVYVQKAHAFGLPSDPSVPVIMVGPGTGVAPFRAFLHERMATRATGPNWLFFGHQRREHDFFYEDELTAMKASGVLTRLSLAWSRDGDHKFYVQDRMREVGRDLWSWLADGAHFYVCGDAKRMAKDVERALVDIVAQYGARTTDEAVAFLAELKKNGRYQQDVY
ncbi:sulfite reductase subunit alpha [Pseudorhodoplanes sinuspersici]|uniref:assimilatory sulfite reductase (NADPH) n=1 Tax=Pseudorhodoplanes sinuspersici TaxID=1235591 RepID=A0A1W6ZT46_9HYPH|nr:sulfite reductase subunit alpha [Pseudorhodoplanes sinuspersici]ARQ00587.1 sulfite reductase [Pseudorhodoplanes sinuspersici]RKE72183.1 NAD(P)H-dependent nitrite reductase flavoprotein subunit [Pseudorhodoplanes sinuspersici]